MIVTLFERSPSAYHTSKRRYRWRASMRALLSSKEVKVMLGVSAATLPRWRSSGEGPPFLTVGKGIFRYRPESVEQWVKENEK